MDQKTFNDEQIKSEEIISEANLPEEKTRIRFTKKWKDRSAASKAGTITAAIIFIVCLVGIILVAFCRQIFGDKVGDSIFGVGVSNGFVALWNAIVAKKAAIFGTLIAIFIAMIIKFLVDLIVNLLSHRSKRGRTVGSLIKSLFNNFLTFWQYWFKDILTEVIYYTIRPIGKP